VLASLCRPTMVNCWQHSQAVHGAPALSAGSRISSCTVPQKSVIPSSPLSAGSAYMWPHHEQPCIRGKGVSACSSAGVLYFIYIHAPTSDAATDDPTSLKFGVQGYDTALPAAEPPPASTALPHTLLPTALRGAPAAAAVRRVLALLTVLRGPRTLLRAAAETCDAAAGGAFPGMEPAAAAAVATTLPARLPAFAAAAETLPLLPGLSCACVAACCSWPLCGWLGAAAAAMPDGCAARLGLMSCAAPMVLSRRRCCCCWVLLLLCSCCCQLCWMWLA
jgi:hypothetical protein